MEKNRKRRRCCSQLASDNLNGAVIGDLLMMPYQEGAEDFKNKVESLVISELGSRNIKAVLPQNFRNVSHELENETKLFDNPLKLYSFEGCT